MGSWFSNIHIRKTDHITEETISECVTRIMCGQKYHPIPSEEDADAVVTVLSFEDSQWISVCSHSFAHDDPESCARVAAPLSSELHTDVMGIACFDSDYLYLNLLNTDEQIDAWVGIGRGKDVGISRRNNLASWKKKVADYKDFSTKSKHTFIIADEFLNEAAVNLGLPVIQSTSSIEYLQEMPTDVKKVFLYFRQEENTQNPNVVRLAHYDEGFPCLVERESDVTAISIGAESKGLSIYFTGPYVEHEEITFSNVRFGRHGEAVPIELTRVQMPDGQWAYSYHDPDFPIPPKVPDRMPKEKRYFLSRERWFSVWFTPHGNSRKTLDITVVFVPDANPDGKTSWNVWRSMGSKKAFIEHHNKIWKRLRAFEAPEDCLPLLKEKDFDE